MHGLNPGLRVELLFSACAEEHTPERGENVQGAGFRVRLESEGHFRRGPAGVTLGGFPQLNQGAADCNPEAVDLAAKLSRGKDAKATELHKESLRIAAGACVEHVLSRISSSEVPVICSSVSSWTLTQTARELRRRIAEIERDERLRQSERGKACRAAYVHELRNTRVGIKAR